VEPAITYPPDLPISEHRDDLVAAICAHQVLVVAGATGSGKSTQLPKLCLEAGRGSADPATGRGGWIGHTQPRRIAARSIAERVAEELGSQVGQAVGYKVRFNDEVGDDTRIKVMTDGILLAEIQRDRQLQRYDTIIVDEAHERSLNIDFLLGYLRQLLPRRPDLKLIITSATIDTARFSEHFDDAPVIEVEGRTFPVEVRYRPLDDPSNEQGPLDQVEGICSAVQELRREVDGDVLVFCAGEREIRDAAAAIEELQLPDTEVFPLFARLSSAEQHRVFERHAGRRVVLATNVAETSLTVPGIRSVVDPGTARISRYSHRTKVQRLPIEAISQASADQRSGRCGRVGPGIAIRLYDETDFLARPEFTEPEIRRTNLASVILQMANLGLGDVEAFPFVDPPDARNIRDGIALLEELGAVDPARYGTRRWLTSIGRRLVRLPVDPRLGRMVIESGENGCLHEVLVIAAAMSIQDPRERPFDERARADQLHARFNHPDSDFLTYVNLWNHLREQRRERSANQFRRMCRDELLNHNRIREWQDVHEQLRRAAKQLGFTPNSAEAEPDLIHLSLLSGLLSHIGMKEAPSPKGRSARGRDGGRQGKDRRASAEFIGARQARFAIARGSVLTKHPPNWVMAGELVETNRLWARTVTRIEPEWVERVGEHLAKYSYGEPWWDRERGAAMTTERVTVYGLTVVAGRRVPVAGVDAQMARELFIHHALLEGDWEAQHAFMERNGAISDEAERLEARARRSDLVVERQAIFDFYDRHLPDDVTSGPEFNRWWKAERRRDPTLLDMTLDDLLADDAQALIDPHAFPEVWHDGIHELAVSYEFNPTSDDDGATITIDAGIVGQLDPTAFDWNVPGFRDELIDALIRTLPKQLRKLFVPVPDTVALISPHVTPDGGSVVEGVRRELNRMLDVPLPVDAFDLDALPKHLRPTFRIVGTDGRELASGKDLRALAAQVRAESAAIVATVDTGLEQRGLRSWSFGELPRTMERVVDGRSLVAYPAIADEGDSVGVVACTSAEDQATTMWAGTRRLVRLSVPGPARQVDALLDERTRRAMAQSPVQSKVDWYNDIIGGALDHLIARAGGPAWDAAAFDRLVDGVRDGLHEALGVVAGAAAELIERHTALRARLDQLVAAPLAPAVADVRGHLDRLVYPGVLTGVGFARLADVDRYLRAIERRLAVLPDRPQRDAELMARCRRLEAEYDDLVATVSPSAELEALAWSLEELRVSSFAQQLRTPVPVSEQRIRKEIHRIARGL
jgi:ATP-dependent helicase HrpA